MWNQFDNNPSLSTQTHRIIVWLAIVIINVVIIAHTEVGWESYNNVVYLENYLRAAVVAVLHDMGMDSEAVLGYESYLRRQREHGPKWWEIPGPLVSFGLLIGGVTLFAWVYPWTRVEWVAVPINAVLTVVTTKVTIKMVRRRQDIGVAEDISVQRS
jgi:hypothetical protein